jgi:CheY-like chemotaxis protein
VINGKKALKMIKEDVARNKGAHCSYSLILMDYNMPFMDGCETTQAIRQYLYDKNLD